MSKKELYLSACRTIIFPPWLNQSDHCFLAASLLKLSSYTTRYNYEAKAGYQDRKEDLPAMTTYSFIYLTKSEIREQTMALDTSQIGVETGGLNIKFLYQLDNS